MPGDPEGTGGAVTIPVVAVTHSVGETILTAALIFLHL